MSGIQHASIETAESNEPLLIVVNINRYAQVRATVPATDDISLSINSTWNTTLGLSLLC